MQNEEVQRGGGEVEDKETQERMNYREVHRATERMIEKDIQQKKRERERGIKKPSMELRRVALGREKKRNKIK